MNKEIWNFNVKVHNYYYQIQYINNAPRDNFPRRNFNPIHKKSLEKVLERLEVDLTREFHRRGIQDHYAARKEVCGHEFRINNPTFPPFDEA